MTASAFLGVGWLPLGDPTGNFGGLRWQASSPAINASNNNAVSTDTRNLDKASNTTEKIFFDLNDNPRFGNNPNGDDIDNDAPTSEDKCYPELHGVVTEKHGEKVASLK